MSLPDTIQRIYQELGQRYERQHESRLRDIFYLLAADVAYSSGRSPEAERLHRKMLDVNPNSLLRPYPSFAAALKSLDIQDYLADLRRQFPPEEAEALLAKVRANPLGNAPEPRTLSQKDTQEVIPATARTVNMPPPTKPSQKKSPYEQFLAATSADDEPSWSASVSLVWLAIIVLTGAGLAIWSLVRPFWIA